MIDTRVPISIAVLGDPEAREACRQALATLGIEAMAIDHTADFSQYYPQTLVLLPITTGITAETEHAVRRLVHRLPEHTGLVVGLATFGLFRKAAKGFRLRYRWLKAGAVWPGVKDSKLSTVAAARVAHEKGLTQALIKQALNPSHD